MSRNLRWIGSAALVVAVFAALAWNKIDVSVQASKAGPAPKHFIESAREGGATEQYELAKSYLGTPNIARNLPQALYWFAQAAQRGHARAQSALGHMLVAGHGIAVDPGAGQRWIEWTEQAGDELSAAPEEAIEWLEKAADQGETDAQLRLALALENGEAGEPDYVGAVRWYRKAARSGDRLAQFNAAGLYDDDRLGERDAAEAATWYRLAAEQGHAAAQARLAAQYSVGDGVHPRHDEAARWARASAEQGDADGCYAYAVLHLKGFGVEQDFDAALHWHRQAANLGHAAAQNMLGTVYFAGEEAGGGVEQDLVEAERWWRMAADQGYAPSQFNLGGMFSRELSLSLDRDEAMQWLEAAADQGHRRAALELKQLAEVAYPNSAAAQSARAFDATF